MKNIIEDFTKEELKNYCSCLMQDLRTDWSCWDEYENRIDALMTALKMIDENHPDLTICIHQLSCDDTDGRFFRSAELYDYSSEEGETKRVRDELLKRCSHPEYSVFDIKS